MLLYVQYAILSYKEIERDRVLKSFKYRKNNPSNTIYRRCEVKLLQKLEYNEVCEIITPSLIFQSFPSTINIPAVRIVGDGKEKEYPDSSVVTINESIPLPFSPPSPPPPPRKAFARRPTLANLHNFTTMTPQEIAQWIDRRSRIVFPAAFLIFNILYWSFIWI